VPRDKGKNYSRKVVLADSAWYGTEETAFRFKTSNKMVFTGLSALRSLFLAKLPSFTTGCKSQANTSARVGDDDNLQSRCGGR
jgi:hypothetical protein